MCKCRCIAVSSEKKFVEGSLINVNVVDVMTNKNTQIGGFMSESKPVPAKGVESKLVLGGGGQNVEDRRFFSINTKARDVGERINGLGEESDSLEGVMGQNSVVGEGPDDGSSYGRGLGQEGVVSQDKE